MLTRRGFLGAAVAGAGAVVVGDETRSLRGATFNLLIHRDPYTVRVWLGHYARAHRLDFVLLQEVTGYHHALRQIAGYRLVTSPGRWPGSSETAVLVRDGIRVDRRRAVRCHRRWLRRDGASWHPARTFTGCRLDGWLAVLSVHMPPSVDVHGKHLHGPEYRARAFSGCADRLASSPGWDLMGGDWNESQRPRGRHSPQWVARRRGWRLFPGASIDYAMGRPGLVVSSVHVERDVGGSDHPLVSWRVSSRA